MYSLVLMAALSGSATAPATWGCHGCHGCGRYYSSCGCYGCGYSYGCGGCYSCGYSYGCGSYSYGCGSCGYVSYGCGYSGCYSSYSCGHVSYGCHGCGGYVSYGCYGCHGVSYGCCGSGGVMVHPGTPVQGTPVPAGGAKPPETKPMAPPASGTPPPPVKKEDEAGVKPPTEPEIQKVIGDLGPAPAQLVVNLPAQARLTIENQPTTATSGSRRFVSPALQPGRDYSYTLRAELVEDGTPITATKEVIVRAGETSEVTFDFAPRTVTQK